MIQKRYGEVAITYHQPRVVVVAAPERTAMTLALLVGAAKDQLSVSFDRVYIGNDARGDEVAYRVVGWDPEAASLILERDWSGGVPK